MKCIENNNKLMIYTFRDEKMEKINEISDGIRGETKKVF